MLIVLIIFTILAVIISAISENEGNDWTCFISAMGAVIFGIFSLFVIGFCIFFIGNGITATQK